MSADRSSKRSRSSNSPLKAAVADVLCPKATSSTKASLPPGAADRFRNAAAAGIAMSRLREERRRCGFEPVALSEYLRRLARRSGQQLDVVYQWAGVAGSPRSLVEQPAAAVRVARGTGILRPELEVHLGLDFLDAAGIRMSPGVARGARGGDPLIECAEAVRGALAELPAADRHKWDEMNAVLASAAALWDDEAPA
jgi:hypothetical protein